MRNIFHRRLAVWLPLTAALTICLAWSAAAGDDEDTAGWLGVSLQHLTPSLREAMDVTADAGVLITEVAEDSPAEKAGLQEGDVIVTYDGKSVTSPHRLTRLVRKTDPGATVEILISRKGKEKTVKAKIGEQDLEKEHRIHIYKDGEKRDIFMDFDEDAFLLGLPPYPKLWFGHDVWLGVHPMGLTDQLAEYFQVSDGRGVLIGTVEEDSPAQKAGLSAGDVIIKIDEERIEDTMDLHEVIDEHEEGDQVAVVVVRDGLEKTFTATLEESPENFHMTLKDKMGRMTDKIHKMKIKTPSRDLVDIYVDKEIAEEELEDLKEQLEELQEELERVKEKLEMK